MSVAQIRGARRRGKLYRRMFGPHAVDKSKADRRLAQRIAGERDRMARSKGKGK